MKPEAFPSHIRPHLIPRPCGEMFYECRGCGRKCDIARLIYTCPACGEVLLLKGADPGPVRSLNGRQWREVLDYRRMLNLPALKGVFRYHEFIAPVIPLERIVYLGEGHTPLVEAGPGLRKRVGVDFFFKNDGLNPSASFKDRGMACAMSYINTLVHEGGLQDVVAVCASTGDTSAAAALYAAYLQGKIKSAVLLPKGKVTPQQLSQPLGSGARVLEIPGVFDDCMKIVEALAEHYPVALLNSKNSWRILGQESFSYEIAQDFDYAMADKVIVLPVGNAGNITAVMSGFLKFLDAGVIDALPKVIGVQSSHADPVYRYYQADANRRRFEPVTVRPSVAQAAMIGNPVSIPRVIALVREYEERAGGRRVFFVQVREQEIMDAMILANRSGHIACTQGGESMAGLRRAVELGHVAAGEIGIVDATAHALKFAVFQEMYFSDSFEPDFDVTPRPELMNAPLEVRSPRIQRYPEPGRPLKGDAFQHYVREMAAEIARILELPEK